MNVNKKLGRFKQWAGERMGGEIKTSVSDDFKSMETEMNLRQEGMEKMHKSMTNYVKSISKRSEETKEKSLPIAHLGGTLLQHGDEFEHDSEFGRCLTAFGRTQERLARVQEAYIIAATNSWLESLEKSLVQMKEYQAARRKLEQRRLAYDTSLAKMQKAKREDFRVEEELRSQKVKYEEAEEDVCRRMMEIRESESDSTSDLGAFMDAQLEFHEKSRQALLQMQNEWPVSQQQFRNRPARANARSRSNTARSMVSDHSQSADLPIQEPRGTSQSYRVTSSRQIDPYTSGYDDNVKARPVFPRSTTFDSRAEPRRDISPVEIERLPRVPSDSLIKNMRSTLKNTNNVNAALREQDVFADDSTLYSNSSDLSYGDRSFSSTTSYSTGPPVMPSAMAKKKPPPPPPPSRATKPPPPPPPAKRTLIT